MNEPAKDPSRPARSDTDEQYADAYSNGYGEGLREALRELLALTGRGHTTQELRFLIEGRLARIREDVEVKRRSLLAPPRRTTWTGRPHATPEVVVAGAVGPREQDPPVAEAGHSYLFLETRPAEALAFAAAQEPRFTRLVAVGRTAPSHERLAPGRWTLIAVGGSAGAPGGSTTYDLPGAAGRVRDATEGDGGALVYLDAIEYLVTEFGLETTFRFVAFLIGQAQQTGSVLVVSEDSAALAPTDQSRFQRLFNNVR